ncbi:MAG: HAMP domain-containing histidine kinase [Epsilonproteobacteria bacterium]|nr:HAMP domain-containing histidine kinase [Campylobacterota bacterium]
MHNIAIFSSSIENLDDIDEKVKNLHRLIKFRITIIDKNGVVIAESDKDKTLLENHLNRAEVLQSKYKEYGVAIRYSTTLQKDLLYVSKKVIINNEEYFIRMARDLAHIDSEFFALWIKIAGVFLIFIVFAFFATLKISKNIEQEIKLMLDFLKNLTKQKKAEIIESNYSIEMNKISKLLTIVSESLSKKDKQKEKYTAKLKLSNRQKDDIISAISHEFKNPIAVISGYTQTLLNDKDINQKIRDRFLEKIETSAKKMTAMIDRLRLSINLEDGKMENKIKHVHLKDLIKMQIEDIKEAYPNREILFEGEDIVKEVDETLFGVAVINLIENALKYSQDRVYIKLSDEKISVQDNGIGIAQKEIENITKKFYRVSTNGWNNSLGVGLSLVSNILNLHNFKLNITSVENEGSTFEIVFYQS